jgi:ferredoxin
LRTGCRAGACGRCRVEVLYDTGVLSLPTEREIKCLRIIGVQNLAINRLACQARIANEGSIGLSQQGVKS